MSQSADLVDTSNIASLSTSAFPSSAPTINQKKTEENFENPLPSLKDLPSLGSNSGFSDSKIAWGPNMKPAASIPMSQIKKNNASKNSTGSNRLKTIQENLTLDLQAQLDITKQELSKLVSSIKSTHNVSIESTLSRNSRTFLISGLFDKVREAKRDLVKTLTKPVNDKFEVPAKCRSVIIGSAGKTIRELSTQYDVKINVAKENIENSFNEDLNDEMCFVTLYGDSESVKLAKQKIIDIVKEDTKNATIKIVIENENLLPFLSTASFESMVSNESKISYFDNKTSADLIITGLRETVKSEKLAIQKFLNHLSTDISEQKIKIPNKFQTVIDADELKEKFNVIVKFPNDPTDEFVSFIGQDSNVKDAIAYARDSSKTFSVDSLDISKAHSNNVTHAKYLALYFNKYPDVLKPISEQFPAVKITLPTVEELKNRNLASVNIIFSAKSEDVAEIKSVRKEIINFVNNITPADTLVIEDIDYELFHTSVKHTLLGSESNAGFIQLGDYIKDDDTIVLLAPTSDEDFKPSMEEIQESLQTVNHSLDSLRAKQNSMETKVFDISADKQVELFNADSITLPLILEDVKKVKSHIQFKLHTPKKDQLTIKGEEKAVKLTTKIIEIITAEGAKRNKISFTVPSNTIARLVGNKGSNLQQIREKFDVQVDIPQVQAQAQSVPVEISVTGFDYNLEHAKAFILSEANKWADIITKELVVPLKYHRNLMGPSASYRNRLQDKYNVHINFPRTSEIVTVRGPSRGVKSAFEELKSLLDFEMENGHKIVMQVPADHVPRVIGKNGDTINDIRAEFGVEMDFLQKNSDESVKETGVVDLEITGTRQTIKDAQTKVEQIVKEAEDFATESMTVNREYHRTIVGSGGNKLREIISTAGGDEIKNKSINIPNASSDSDVITIQGPKSFVKKVMKAISKIVEDGENSTTKKLDVAKERHGALVGPGGMVRRQLETEFNVIIQVPNKDQEGPVTITGLSENIEKAEKKIKTEILKDDFDVEIKVPASIHQFVSERGALIQKLRLDDFVNVKHGNATRRATKLNRTQLEIPIEKVRPEGESAQKVKITIEDVGEPRVASEEGEIPWKLTYEPIDYSELLGETEEEGESKPKESKPSAEKKKEALAKATKIIEDRIALVHEATYAGYIWTSEFKNFNKIVGPGGSNIKKIRDATNTLINVPRKNDTVNDVIYIRGTKEGVTKAAEAIIRGLN